MSVFDWLAAVILFFHLPIPLYWLILHPAMSFWRQHTRAGFWVAGLSAWISVAFFLKTFHKLLFASDRAPAWALALGIALVAADGFVFYQVKRELGSKRLVGRAEMEGAGELATTGIYARVRHPRYAGSMMAVLGACLVAGTLALWVVAACWWLLLITSILLEEHELRRRFGASYEAYCKRVPRFLPLRFWPREN
jgi:protein-S-isoprenylcysteine O-methyltransferase Ste14